MNKAQRNYLMEIGSLEPSVVEQRAAGKCSLESRQPGKRFAVICWYDDEPFAIEQAKYMARNFSNDYRVRCSRAKTVFEIEGKK